MIRNHSHWNKSNYNFRCKFYGRQFNDVNNSITPKLLLLEHIKMVRVTIYIVFYKQHLQPNLRFNKFFSTITIIYNPMDNQMKNQQKLQTIKVSIK